MKNIFWLDLEMTGLDDSMDHILEVAAIVTDMELEVLAEFHRVVFQPHEVLERMDDWCKKTHKESGLTPLIENGEPLEKVEKELLEFVAPYFPKEERIILCGNSIGNDQRFVMRHMKNFSKRMHYRVIDVSSFKEISKNKYGVDFQKKNAHRALDDIKESISELKKYFSFIHVP
jgi:oligoribonuclease